MAPEDGLRLGAPALVPDEAEPSRAVVVFSEASDDAARAGQEDAVGVVLIAAAGARLSERMRPWPFVWVPLAREHVTDVSPPGYARSASSIGVGGHRHSPCQS